MLSIIFSACDDVCFIAGGANVHHCGVNLRILLAALSWLFYIRLPQQLSSVQ